MRKSNETSEVHPKRLFHVKTWEARVYTIGSDQELPNDWFAVRLSENATVADLKKALSELKEGDPEMMDLVWGGKVLQDTDRLEPFFDTQEAQGQGMIHLLKSLDLKADEGSKPGETGMFAKNKTTSEAQTAVSRSPSPKK